MAGRTLPVGSLVTTFELSSTSCTSLRSGPTQLAAACLLLA